MFSTASAQTDRAARADSSAGGHGDLVGSAKQLLVAGLAHLRTRLELLGIELSIEKTRMLTIAALGAATLLFAIMAMVTVVLLVVAAFWDGPNRVAAVAWLLALFVVLAGGAAYMLMEKFKQPSVLFAASAAELAKDEQALRQSYAGAHDDQQT